MEHSPFFFADDIHDDETELTGGDARHLTVVRRAQPGDKVTVSDGIGHVHLTAVTSVSESRVTLKVLSSTRVEPETPSLTLIQGIPKSDKAATVIEKAVEVGADSIVMFHAERSVPRWDPGKQARMNERFRAIAVEAAKQSRAAWLPGLVGPCDLEEALAQATGRGLALVAHEKAEGSLAAALPAHAPGTIALVVGPEGGLTDREVTRFKETGALAVHLGRRILRTETAGLVAAAAILFRYGRFG